LCNRPYEDELMIVGQFSPTTVFYDALYKPIYNNA
jgi:hypothetical protein